ncbi:MAG TPA: 5-formyltetrahydrofolate cyclo-ligase [Clostridia bacterium]|nr:5-formyltetrahydrofolate cyclo-ligase [Clostridia bacterium]
MDQKPCFRRMMLDKRNSLSTAEVAQKSEAILKRLASIEKFGRAGTIMAYMSFGSEVSTAKLIEECLQRGKKVVVPRVEKGAPDASGEVVKALGVYEIKEAGKYMTVGYMGIAEPDPASLRRVEPSEIDLVVVPGVAFDRQRNRIGYGGGYYDRFLGTLRPDCLKAGVAFELQVCDYVPVAEYDLPVDIVITEDRII